MIPVSLEEPPGSKRDLKVASGRPERLVGTLIAADMEKG